MCFVGEENYTAVIIVGGSDITVAILCGYSRIHSIAVFGLENFRCHPANQPARVQCSTTRTTRTTYTIHTE